MVKPDRDKTNPCQLKTPPGSSEYTMHMDQKDGGRVLVCTVGKTVLLYDARCIDDLQAMLKAAGDWVELGGADEQKAASEGRHGRSLGPFAGKPDRRLVWPEERPAWSLRRLSAAVDGSPGPVRA